MNVMERSYAFLLFTFYPCHLHISFFELRHGDGKMASTSLVVFPV